MTTNRDELLTRMADALRRVTTDWVQPYDGGEFEDGEMPALDAVRSVLAEYDSLPQRPEGAEVPHQTVSYKSPRPLGKPSDYTFSGEPQTLEELRAELESPPASAVAEPVACKHPRACEYHGCDGSCGMPAQAATVSEEGLVALVCEAMQDAWNDICIDSGSHPTDIVHGARTELEFRAGQWARATATFLQIRARERNISLASSPAAPAPVIPESEKGR